MQIHHSTERDLPTLTQRDRDRMRIAQAMAEYHDRGGDIKVVEPSHRAPKSHFVINAEKTAQLKSDAPTNEPETLANVPQEEIADDISISDVNLVRLLKAHCLLGHSLDETANKLGLPLTRCCTVARREKIPFRSPAFRRRSTQP